MGVPAGSEVEVEATMRAAEATLGAAVAAALDHVGGDVEEVFVIFFLGSSCTSFNAFYRRGALVGQPHALGFPDTSAAHAPLREFFRDQLGAGRALTVDLVGRGLPVPTEVRAWASVSDGSARVAARFDEVLTEDVGVHDIVRGWMDEVRASTAPAP